MEFINRLTDASEDDRIITDLLEGVEGAFDLGVLYVCPWQPYDPIELYRALRDQVKVRHFLCCTCAGIIGTDKEIEGRPSASLMLARLPGVELVPFSLNQAELEGLRIPADWYNFLEVYPNERPSFLVFPDPFLIDANGFLAKLNLAYPGSSIVGGLASAASGPQENVLIVDGEVFQEGLVGVCLKGNISVETVVSQGCRPVGETYIITKAENNIIYELGGKPFYKVLEAVLNSGTEYDRHLARQLILIGIATNEYVHEFKRGDFLVRGILSVDPANGAGVVGELVRAGQTVQFHLRDAKTANEDLHELLKMHKDRPHAIAPHGALVFTCNGRGFGLFGQQDHDIRIIQQHLGPIPAAGFFCAGEIGPVGGVNFLHGFTNSMALFYPQR